MRLSPWIPEHDRYIRARIAALTVEDPKEAVQKSNQYAEILAKYHKEHPELSITPMPPELVKEIERNEKNPVKAKVSSKKKSK